MPNYEKLTENLTRRGYTVQRFPTARQAADYLDSVCLLYTSPSPRDS